MHPDIRREIEHLVSVLSDGDLTESERTRLDELLQSDAENRRLYLEIVELHARLLSRPELIYKSSDIAVAQPATPKTRSRRRLLSHALVAAAAIALTITFQLLWWSGEQQKPDKTKSPSASASSSDYVATFTYGADCNWELPGDSLHEGTRLVPGQVRLRRGLARIRFDTGAELLIEGPTSFRVNSASSATVFAGKVVFKADETATPFDLRTPTASLVDFGTEYAVFVGSDAEEVHVFEGEVHRTPHGMSAPADVEQIAAGEAWRFDSTPGVAGRRTPLDPARFVREAPDAANPGAGLLAYEGFDYRDPELLAAGRAGGGMGWANPWVFAFARPVGDGKQAGPPLNVRDGLRRPGAATQPIGGSFDYIGFTKSFRKLNTPVRLDTDGVYYMSYLFRHHGPPADPTNAVAILLWTDEDAQKQDGDRHHRLNTGVGGANQVFTHIQGVGSRTPLPLTYGETYLLVAKVVARRDQPDQVFIRVYAPLEPVERDESDGWSVTGPPFSSDLVFPWVQLHINSSRRQTIDEFRLGTTWSSVTSPWVRKPEGKN